MISTKFVGVIISDDLKWKEHTNVVSNKVSKSIGVLNKIRYILPVSVLSILYCTFILPYYQYCNIDGLVITLLTYINYICCKNEPFISLAKLSGVTTLPYYLKEIGN